MHKVVVYVLLVLFAVVFSYETIVCISKKVSEKFFAEVVDIETESSSDSKDDSNDSTEKKNTLEDYYLHATAELLLVGRLHTYTYNDLMVVGSGYRTAVFSPPELLSI